MRRRASLPRLTAPPLLTFALAVFLPSPAESQTTETPSRADRPAIPGAVAQPSRLTTPTGEKPRPKDTPRESFEDLALGVPNPENARRWLRQLTAQPHVAGTRADYDTAVDVKNLLQSWGWEAQIVEYEVLLNYPKNQADGSSALLEIVKPHSQTLKVIEDAYPLDKDSANSRAFGAFHGYGVSGDVRGQVIYVNYGRPDDFEALEKQGVDVKGKIVLVRYGEIFRGLKVYNAQKRGAIGILIYSDPMDDGFMKGDVYPVGPYRPASALQRGSVQFLSLGPGDPSTPNGPSTKGAKRLPVDPRHGFTLAEEGAQSTHEWERVSGLKREDYFATIPSLPISYESAKPILDALGGPVVPSGWQGGLPLTYHVGPGPVEVHLKVEMDYAVRPIWNVVATLRGTLEPDRWIMVGNHRDAWVYGAADPSSGTAATLEMCRALGTAVKSGWKPRRTLVYASWDAEEYGLVGSTEYVDEHAKEIGEKAVMLLNVDTAVSGPEYDIDGVPSLRDFLLDASSKITDLRSGKSLREVWLAKQKSRWAATAPVDFADPLWADDAARVRRHDAGQEFVPQLNALGSGSDYTAFLDHLGVPAIDVGFTGRYGVYHAIYDNFFWMEKFGDPEFAYHTTAAKVYTLVAMRAASVDVLPFRFKPYGWALRESVDEYRRAIVRQNRGAEPGTPASNLTFTNLNRLAGAVKEFQLRAEEVDAAAEDLSRGAKVEPARLAKFNDALMQVERAFLLREGLPGRPWFRHSIYAPGLTTGYAAWVFPGMKQALQNHDADLFAQQVIAVSQRIDAASEALRRATAIAREEEPPGAPVEPAKPDEKKEEEPRVVPPPHSS